MYYDQPDLVYKSPRGYLVVWSILLWNLKDTPPKVSKSRNPFHGRILGLQTTKPNHQRPIPWLSPYVYI